MSGASRAFWVSSPPVGSPTVGRHTARSLVVSSSLAPLTRSPKRLFRACAAAGRCLPPRRAALPSRPPPLPRLAFFLSEVANTIRYLVGTHGLTVFLEPHLVDELRQNGLAGGPCSLAGVDELGKRPEAER